VTPRSERLEDVFARFAWAQEHHRRLLATIDDYTTRPPFTLSEDRDAAGNLVITAELHEPAPREIGLQLSDLAHQYRATLDNLVGALRPDGPTERTAFPLARTPEAFAAQAFKRGLLEGLPEWAIDVVRGLQPLPQNPLAWQSEYLVLLHDIARQDRHRALPVHGTIVEADAVEVTLRDTRVPVTFRQDGLARADVILGPDGAGTPHFGVTVWISGLQYRGDPDVVGISGAIDCAVLDAITRADRATVANGYT
jgi:hypothetical protein